MGFSPPLPGIVICSQKRRNPSSSSRRWMANPFRFRYTNGPRCTTCSVRGNEGIPLCCVFRTPLFSLTVVTLPSLFFTILTLDTDDGVCYEITYDGHDHELYDVDDDAIFLFAPLVCLLLLNFFSVIGRYRRTTGSGSLFLTAPLGTQHFA